MNWHAPLSNSPQGSSWYLDPLVAAQKRKVHQHLARRWMGESSPRTVLKTDVFEEAYGEDQILLDLFPEAAQVVGMDIAPAHAVAARRRSLGHRCSFVVTDVRRPAFRQASFDLVLSNSTLDHFETPGEIRSALGELARVLRPGGTLIVTLDNPANPLYPALRWISRRSLAPFSLGCTISRWQLNAWLEEFGLVVTANDWLIHNPRLVSTALFLALRRSLGRFADTPIGALLWLFHCLGRLPTRPFTACFLAACARKPGGAPSPPPLSSRRSA